MKKLNLEKELLEKLLIQEKSYNKVAKVLGVAVKTVERYCKKYNLAGKYSEEKFKNLFNMFPKDKFKEILLNNTEKEICKQYNITMNDIRFLKTNYNIFKYKIIKKQNKLLT